MLVAAGPHRDQQGQRQVAWWSSAPLRWHAWNGEARHAGSSGIEFLPAATRGPLGDAWQPELLPCLLALRVGVGVPILRARLQTLWAKASHSVTQAVRLLARCWVCETSRAGHACAAVVRALA